VTLDNSKALKALGKSRDLFKIGVEAETKLKGADA
jgi:hypothetical protein